MIGPLIQLACVLMNVVFAVTLYDGPAWVHVISGAIAAGFLGATLQMRAGRP